MDKIETKSRFTGSNESAPKISDIVSNGLCIGCGLCESIAGSQNVQMTMTPEGRLRPMQIAPVQAEAVQQIYRGCPGTRIGGLPDSEIDENSKIDPVWGPYRRMDVGYAGDEQIRYKAATGGVMTALASHLLDSGKVDFILHVAASADKPMRTERQLSFTTAQVLDAAGSRYGPAAPLVDVMQLLERKQTFAFVGKPCDVTALRNLAEQDPRVDQYCRYKMAIVCGGASELGKSQDVLDDFGIREQDLSLFRYRGHGNPGATRLETKNGRSFEKTYNEMWGDEAGWRLQFRCKICADAIGEGADIAASDIWPGGDPSGDDAGFNGVITRTKKGEELLASAIEAGALIIEGELGPRDMDGFQPHQVRKKQAVWSRLKGLERAGQLVPEVTQLRIQELAKAAGTERAEHEAEGTYQRALIGKTSEPEVRSELSSLTEKV
ncbi:MAG TPA: coenzyme F420 hydrogenase [Porticoccaceae bacterium]|nr:coenzyme F420 hydrogenase [Porticoccaceae bacterium]